MGRILSFLYRLLLGILAVLCASLTGIGFLITVVFRQYAENDYPDMIRLNPVPVLAAFLVCVVFLWLLLYGTGAMDSTDTPKLSGRGVLLPDPWFITALVLCAGFCSFLLWAIRGLPTNDANLLDGVIRDFLRGDFSDISSGYLAVYPFQLSYCLIGEGLTLYFGAGNYLIYQLLNIVSILLTLFFLYETTWELFADIRICRAFSLISIGCLPLYVYSTYIYNDIWSLAPLFGGFWFLIRFMKSGKLLPGVLAALLSALSFFIKSNGTIALVAMGGILAADALRILIGKNGKLAAGRLVILLLMIALSLGLRRGVNAWYEHRSGLAIASGVPAAAYFAMGMEETDGKFGWYNGTNAGYLADAGGDAARASEAAMIEVRELLEERLANPKAFLRFYGMKFLQQWADPTAASLREQELTGRHQEGLQPSIAGSLIYGWGYRLMQAVMHLFHLLLCFFAAAALLRICLGRSRVTEILALLPLFVIGGILFHELWEASGRYTLRYTLALLPFAAAGVIQLLGRER